MTKGFPVANWLAPVLGFCSVSSQPHHLDHPALSVARRDFTTLSADRTVGEALEEIRQHTLVLT